MRKKHLGVIALLFFLISEGAGAEPLWSLGMGLKPSAVISYAGEPTFGWYSGSAEIRSTAQWRRLSVEMALEIGYVGYGSIEGTLKTGFGIIVLGTPNSSQLRLRGVLGGGVSAYPWGHGVFPMFIAELSLEGRLMPVENFGFFFDLGISGRRIWELRSQFDYLSVPITVGLVGLL